MFYSFDYQTNIFFFKLWMTLQGAGILLWIGGLAATTIRNWWKRACKLK